MVLMKYRGPVASDGFFILQLVTNKTLETDIMDFMEAHTVKRTVRLQCNR